MSEVIAKVKGTNGQMTLYDDKLVISRKSIGALISQGVRGDRTIYLNDIHSVEYQKPNMHKNGYIQIILNPEMASDQSNSLIGFTKSKALKDPNTIILRAFKKQTVEDGENLQKELEKRLNNLRKDLNNKKQDNYSAADEIKKYKSLLDEGIITQDEFNAKKKELLDL